MRGKKILKFVVLPLAVAVVLLVFGYQFVTGSWFLRNVALGMVGKAANMTMSAEKIHLSLWRGQLEIHDLRVGNAESPWLKAGFLSGNFELRELIGGNIKLADVLLNGVHTHLNKNADGNWNLNSAKKPANPHQKKSKKTSGKTGEKSAAPPLRLDLTNIKIANSSFTLTTHTQNQATTLELSRLHMTLPSLRPGAEAQLAVRSDLKISSGSDIDVSNGAWQAHFNFTLNDRLIPEKLNLISNINELRGNVGGVDLADNNLALLINSVGSGSRIDVSNLLLRQVHNEQIRTSIAASGAIQFSPFELDLAVNVNPLAEEITAIVASFYKGINPGTVRLHYQGGIDYRASRLISNGELALSRSGNAVVGGKTLTLPPFELTSKHDIELDLPRKMLHLQQFNTEITRERQRLVALSAKRPCSFNWGKTSSLDKDSAPDLTLLINNLDLTLLHLIIAPTDNFTLREGTLDAQLHCRFDQTLDGLIADGQITGRQISGVIGGKNVSEWTLSQQLRLQIEKFDRLVLEKAALSLQQAGRPLATIATEGHYRMSDRVGNLKIAVEDVDHRVIDTLPLSAEQRGKVNEIVTAIAPLELRISGDYNFDLNKNLLQINTSVIKMIQHGRSLLECALKPTTINLGKLTPAQQFQLEINSANLPLAQFNSFLGGGTRITDGELSLVGEVTTNIVGDPLQVALNVSLDEVGVVSGNKHYQGLGAILTSDLKLEKLRALHINQSDLKLSVRRLAAAAVSTRGKLDLVAGKGVVDCRLNYLNRYLLNLLKPDWFTRAESAGSARLQFDDGFKTLAATGSIELANLEMTHSTFGINGNITADIRKTPTVLICEKLFCELRQGRDVAVRLEVVGNVPDKTSNAKTDIRVNADRIDLSLIEKLFADSTATPRHDTRQAEPYGTETRSDAAKDQPAAGFDFGTNPLELNLDLRNITYGQEIVAELRSRILAHGREVVINPFELKLNDSPIAATGKFVSGKDGIGYAVRLASGAVDLGALIRPFVDGHLKKLEATLQELTLNINGTGTQPPDLWDNMNGVCNLRLQQIVIPNEFGDTLIGGLLLLPFEVMSRLQTLLPTTGTSGGILEMLSVASKYRDQFREITLAQGDIRLRAGNRRITIEKFGFSGDFVKSLEFSGSLGLGSDTALDIDSTLNVNNLIIPVKLTGTVQRPAVNYTAVVHSFLRANAINIVNDGVGGAISTGAQGLQNVIQRTIEVIRSPSPGSDRGAEEPAPRPKDENDSKPLDRLLRRILEK